MINSQIDVKITDWINNNKDSIIEKWMKLCEIPSIKSQAKPGAPFGEKCAEALSYASSLFNSENITSELFSESGYALATYGSGEKTIGLFSHSDVVPVGEDWIFTEPFKPIIKDGALICRGAEDNKSGIIAALCATEFFRDNNISLKSRLQTFIGSDEECGMDDMKNYLIEQKMPDVSIVPDADFPCSTGEKGICHFWSKSREKLSNILSISGGEAFNIVLDKVTTEIRYSDALYSELKDKISSNNEFTLETDNKIIKLLARGIAKHASIPDGSVNAAYLTAKLLSECENICENDRKLLTKVKSLLSSSYGETLNVYHEDVNFGKTTTVNGIVKTENGIISLSFDCRYGDTYKPEELEINSKNALNKLDFDIIFEENKPGFSIDKNSEIPLAFEKVYAEITGVNLKSVLMSGGTYARKLNNAFSIGTFVISKDRETSAFKMPDGHGGPHQCDEMIDIEGFFIAVRILIHYILTCDDIINR